MVNVSQAGPFSVMKTEPSFLAPTSQHQHMLREWVGIGSEQGDTPGPRAAGSWGAGRERVWWKQTVGGPGFGVKRE